MLEGMAPPSKESLCKVSIQASSLSKEDLALLQDALKDPRWPHETLALELTTRGFSIGKEAIRRHRRGICNCAR